MKIRRLTRWVAIAGLCAATTVGQATSAQAATYVGAPTITSDTVHFLLGEPATFTFTPDPVGETPVSYQYWISHELPPTQMSTVAAVSGVASITLTPTTRTTFLTVRSVASDTTTSPGQLRIVLADAAVPTADKDMNGDGIPDLITAGGTANLASGLWLAAGRSRHDDDGRLRTPAVNIGVNGTGGNSPTDFDGTQIITGHFLGDGVQDIMAYYPTTFRAGGGAVLSGSGDGSPLQSQISGNQVNILSGLLTDLNGDNPIRLANAYGPYRDYYSDLIGINGNPTNGYYLAYYPNFNGTTNFPYAVQVAATTPTGGTDWENWTLATTTVASGTAMYLWNASTGQLFLWTGVTFTDNGDLTGSVAFTQYRIASNWNTNANLATLEAADFSGDGVPDLWTVTTAGAVTAYKVSRLSTTGTATVKITSRQNLL